MKNGFVPQAIAERTSYSRKVTVGELYGALVDGMRAAPVFGWNRRTQRVDEAFLERVQLAVTAVNACAVCSYVHSGLALKMGLSEAEIHGMLTGEGQTPHPHEAKALLFAEHYADTRCRPERAAYDALLAAYGRPTARVIVAAIQLMIVGNYIGLPLSARRSRKRGKPYSDSSVAYETGMVVLFFLIIPPALVHASVRALLGRPALRFAPAQQLPMENSMP